jgi:hypothetical protein
MNDSDEDATLAEITASLKRSAEAIDRRLPSPTPSERNAQRGNFVLARGRLIVYEISND